MLNEQTLGARKEEQMDVKRASFKPIYPRFVERVNVKNLRRGNSNARTHTHPGSKRDGMIIDGLTRLRYLSTRCVCVCV